jgi:hydroxymethylpyrimidine pyrophosphatase-like HAD family hydrolase
MRFQRLHDSTIEKISRGCVADLTRRPTGATLFTETFCVLGAPNLNPAFVIDVDGVVIGKKAGFNYPFPHPSVIASLRNACAEGCHVSLCTGRALFATIPIIEAASLDCLHIADGGAVIANPLTGEILHCAQLPKEQASALIKMLQLERIHVEAYTPSSYYIEQHQIGALSGKHAEILGHQPTLVDCLNDFVEQARLTKIFVIARDMAERGRVSCLIEYSFPELLVTWGPNPNALPAQYGWVTPRGVSKAEALRTISQHLAIPLKQFVAVGDTMADWEFMSLCGHAGAMGNADPELKELVGCRHLNGVILPDVDNHGLVAILGKRT